MHLRLIGRAATLAALMLPTLVCAPKRAGAQQAAATATAARLSTVEQIKDDFAAVPCRDGERLAAVEALFEKAGAPESDVSVEKYKGVENLVVVKRGESDERIVVGAHYDKVSDGCGAVDNWTGIVAVSHLFRSLKDVPMKKTLVFVAFGKEERGLVGSHAMANAIGKERAAAYCAMVNIDSLGLAPPQVADNMSSRKLRDLAATLAKEMKMPFASAGIPGADSDSSSFMSKRIPAITIHGMSRDWHEILHSSRDQSSKVNAAHVYMGYRLALALITRVDESPCAAYR
jgi:Zn-dependent M28 family amino/carboxypeptidase